MDQVLVNILDEFTIKNAPIITKAIEPLQKHFKIDVCFYAYVNNLGDYWWTGNHMEYSGYIAEKKPFLQAPHLIHPSQILTSYLKPEELVHIPFYQQLVDSYVSILNAKNLFMSIKKYKDYYEIYTFASTHHDNNDCENFYNSPQLQQHFVDYFLNCTEYLRQKANSQCFNLIENGASYFTSNQCASVPHIHVHDHEKFLHDTSINALQQFTCREIDCIRALLAGKTAGSTAKDLDISPRTVETYINNIRSKLGVKYKAEIVAKLVSDNSYDSLFVDF